VPNAGFFRAETQRTAETQSQPIKNCVLRGSLRLCAKKNATSALSGNQFNLRHNLVLLAALLLLLHVAVNAQDPLRPDLSPCAAPPGLPRWLQEYARKLPGATDRSADTLSVGIQVHLVGRDDGTGRFPAGFLLDAFCRLNTDFQAAGLRFYFKSDWHYIDHSGWRNHATIPEGIAMMLANDVPDALNVYFVADPAGACGYNLPYAGLALAHGCLLDGEHTWTHEAGHALSLPHPFIGWEGHPYVYAEPTPTELAYDYTYFHESPDTIVPAPPDVALVENADFSNCGLAADLFCDTPPDYLSQPWPCDSNGLSQVKQKDPAGLDFYADGSLFMSYAAPQCQNRFTEDQIAAMRAFLPDQRPAWLGPAEAHPPVSGPPALIHPVGNATAPAEGTVLEWEPAAQATRYLVQVSRQPGFFPLDVETVVSTTTLPLGVLLPGETYLWRVRAFNAWDACAGWSDTEQFLAADLSPAQEPAGSDWQVGSNVLRPGEPLAVTFGGSALPVSFTVFDALGRLRWQSRLDATVGRQLLPLPSRSWPAGLYRLMIQSGEKKISLPMVLVP
jgi:hypothetical protein